MTKTSIICHSEVFAVHAFLLHILDESLSYKPMKTVMTPNSKTARRLVSANALQYLDLRALPTSPFPSSSLTAI